LCQLKCRAHVLVRANGRDPVGHPLPTEPAAIDVFLRLRLEFGGQARNAGCFPRNPLLVCGYETLEPRDEVLSGRSSQPLGLQGTPIVARLMESIEDLIATVRYPRHDDGWHPFDLELRDLLGIQNRACGARVSHDVLLDVAIDERSRSTVLVGLCATGGARRESTIRDHSDPEVDLKEVLLLVEC
jgi:hypothetical protein